MYSRRKIPGLISKNWSFLLVNYSALLIHPYYLRHCLICCCIRRYLLTYFPPYYNDNSTSVLFINKMHVLSTTTIQVRTYLPTYLSTSLPIYLTAMHLRYISGLKSHQFTLKILKSLEDVHTYSCLPFSLSLYHSLSIRPIIPTMC